jgi:hypothetical protein
MTKRLFAVAALALTAAPAALLGVAEARRSEGLTECIAVDPWWGIRNGVNCAYARVACLAFLSACRPHPALP